MRPVDAIAKKNDDDIFDENTEEEVKTKNWHEIRDVAGIAVDDGPLKRRKRMGIDNGTPQIDNHTPLWDW